MPQSNAGGPSGLLPLKSLREGRGASAQVSRSSPGARKKPQQTRGSELTTVPGREGGKKRGRERGAEGSRAAPKRDGKCRGAHEGCGAGGAGQCSRTPRPPRSGAPRAVLPAPAWGPPPPAGGPTAHSWACSLAEPGIPGRGRHSTPLSLLLFSVSLVSHHSFLLSTTSYYSGEKFRPLLKENATDL